MRFLTAYVLGNAAAAAVPAVAMALQSLVLLAYRAISGGAVQVDLVGITVVASVVNFFVFFGLLVAQSFLWVPVLLWTNDRRSRQISAVVSAPVFGAALYWLGAIAAEAGLQVLGIWWMPFGYVAVAAVALTAVTISFIVTYRWLGGE